jgi:hypothetical protein
MGAMAFALVAQPIACLEQEFFFKKWFFYAIMNRQASGEFLQLHE